LRQEVSTWPDLPARPVQAQQQAQPLTQAQQLPSWQDQLQRQLCGEWWVVLMKQPCSAKKTMLWVMIGTVSIIKACHLVTCKLHSTAAH
jgi:hypothetical protein